ncbi:MFS transporter [Stackebrandtia nassauensis]|uniref:Major facilitator superfamily MFS_1 n=1 Tax=Stackebrandtia nassauensis (strain DSM 44728 / CIP 108903 / NRRL B-16338 / NBRC 102104 / LLR-40K-21) TaxID=446470 RepID=D3Q5Y6_STANL|nr:MFS transporter [Stackebrandtia nassauensis]ADD40285.1 major facilitator superfamily MFS_1 [Stackebrandtia nassauensis DSM 44728]
MRTVRAWFTETTGGLPRAFWHLWTVTLINRLGSFVLIYMTLYLSVVRDFTPTTIGMLVGAQGAGAVVGTQLSGVLTDRWGRRKTLLLSNFSSVAVLTGLAFVQNVWTIGALLAAMGATLNMARPAFSAMIADLVPPADRVRAYTLNYWAINLGFSGAALLAGVAAGLSFQLIFFINAGAVAASGLLILFKLPETRPAPSPVPDNPAGVKPRGSIRVIAADRVFLAFVGLTFLPALLLMLLESLLPLQVTGAGLSQQEYGWIIATNGVVIVAGQLFIPKLVDGKRRSRVLAVSCLFWAAGVGATGLVASVPMFMLTVLIWTFGEMLQTPANSATIADLSPVDMRGRYQSVFALSFQASTMIAPTLGGLGLEYLGAGLWGVGAVIGVVAAVGNLIAEPARERRLARLLAEAETPEVRPVRTDLPDDTGELKAVRA